MIRFTPMKETTLESTASHASLTFRADPDDYNLYFTDSLYAEISAFRRVLPDGYRVEVLPDAAHKTFGLPTGLAVLSPRAATSLYPFLLRDPGCGYTLFRVSGVDVSSAHWQQTVGERLHYALNINHAAPKVDLQAILANGVLPLIEDNAATSFEYTHFPVDMNEIDLTDTEIAVLGDDLMTLSNTVELKRVFQCDQCSAQLSEGDVVGFVHAGGLKFPTILKERFLFPIAEYCHEQGLASLAEINAGHFGIPIDTPLGYRYYQWLKAAMNFALANRYLIFQQVKAIVADTLSCTVSMINDRCHAGVFERQHEGQSWVHAVRGVQQVVAGEPILIAGQRETISVLMHNPAPADAANLIAHGTGYETQADADYAAIQENPYYFPYQTGVFYNTVPEFSHYDAYTTNLLHAVSYFEKSGLARPLCLLQPLVNIQSRFLMH